jgi:hypothetical protein
MTRRNQQLRRNMTDAEHVLWQGVRNDQLGRHMATPVSASVNSGGATVSLGPTTLSGAANVDTGSTTRGSAIFSPGGSRDRRRRQLPNTERRRRPG